MTQLRSPENKIADIQVLRGISILFVLVAHFALFGTLFGHFSKQIRMPFYIGVELFFIISGYVVTKSLMKDEFNAFKFFVKRVFRLLPAILIFLTFSYMVVVLVRWNGVPAGLRQLFGTTDSTFFKQAVSVVGGFFIIAARESPPIYLNGGMWSLSVEDQFYAAIAVVSFIAAISRRLTRIPAKWWVAAASAFLFIAMFRYRLQVLEGRKSFFNLKPGFVLFLLQYNYDFLPLGVLLAIFDTSFRGRVARRFQNTGPAFTGYLLVVPLAFVAVCDDPGDPHHRARFLVGLAMPVTAICFSVLVLLAGNQCAFPATRGRMYRFLEFLGNRSFTYYLFNFPILAVAAILRMHCPDWFLKTKLRADALEIVLVTMLIVPLVELIYRYVEVPLTRLGKRLVDGPRVKTDPVPPATTTDATVLPIPATSVPDKVAA